MVALQTTDAVVLRSNPTSLTVENSEDRQGHCKYCQFSRYSEVETPKKTKKEKTNDVAVQWRTLPLKTHQRLKLFFLPIFVIFLNVALVRLQRRN